MARESAWVSMTQSAPFGEHCAPVITVEPDPVMRASRPFSFASAWTPKATAELPRSVIMSTPSTSYQRRASVLATSGLLWWSAATISIGLPSTVAPKSSTASRAAVTLPVP